jgi:hypothetical protein
MARRSGRVLPRQVDKLRTQIDDWRKTKARRNSPMPAGLWTAAGTLARLHGTYEVAKALGLAHDSLNRRAAVGAKAETGGTAKATPFVELWPGSESRGEGRGDTVEITNAVGDKLVVRLAADNRLDAVALVGAFVRRSS